jgi:DNA-binding CsgD family transcriptional regulator
LIEIIATALTFAAFAAPPSTALLSGIHETMTDQALYNATLDLLPSLLGGSSVASLAVTPDFTIVWANDAYKDHFDSGEKNLQSMPHAARGAVKDEVSSAFSAGPVNARLKAVGMQTGGPLIVRTVCTSPKLTLVSLRDPLRGTLPSEALLSDLFGLTASEARISRLLATGKSPKEISVINRISEATVRVHIRAIYAKLGTTSISQAVALIGRCDLL